MKHLAREEFYDDVPFHRVIDGFMAQTGDGQHGNGTGGSEHPDLKAEFSDVPFMRGTVGMARKGHATIRPTASSSSCSTRARSSTASTPWSAKCVSGMDVVDKLKRGEPPRDPDKIVSRRKSRPTSNNARPISVFHA